MRDIAPFKELMAEPTEENLGSVLELLMEEAFAERGCLWIEASQSLIYRGDEDLKKRFPFSRQVVETALKTGRGFVSFDSRLDERIKPAGSIAVNDIRSCLCSAARNDKGEVLAIVYFDNKTSAGNFTEEDLDFLNQVMGEYPGAKKG